VGLIDINVRFVPSVEENHQIESLKPHERKIPLAHRNDLLEITDLSFHAVDALYDYYNFTPRAMRARLPFYNRIAQDIFQAAKKNVSKEEVESSTSKNKHLRTLKHHCA
jgi:hypothetical protein